MKYILTRVLALLLALVPIVSLGGCAGRGGSLPVIKQEGIVITPGGFAPYSKETVARAEEVFYPLILRYAQNSGLYLTSSVKEHYRTVAAQVAEITAQKPIEEASYIAALAAIGTRGEAVVDELSAYSKSGGGRLDETALLYRALISHFGAETISSIIYRLLLYSCDYCYEDAMAKYAQYKREAFRRQAEAAREEKQTVMTEIGEEAFSAVLSQMLVFGELFFGGALESAQLQSFSDEEILAFLRSMELAQVNIGNKGWQWILEKTIPEEVNENGAYFLRLAAVAKENGDLAALARISNDVFSLGAAVASHLTAEEIALFRSGTHEAALAHTVARFTDAEWERLSRIGAITLKKVDYHNAALALFGDDYAAYAESLTPITAQELRCSIETETFYESLERFVFGISPALSYGMKK